MKAEIDMEGRLLVQPGTLTEQVALFHWWESLPNEAREKMKEVLLPCGFDERVAALRTSAAQETWIYRAPGAKPVANWSFPTSATP